MIFEKATSPYQMKIVNQQKVLNLIYRMGTISRVEIAEKTNLTQQTITNIVRRLLDEKLVVEYESSSSSVGRKPKDIKINSSNLYAIGVEVSVKKIIGVLINFDRRILKEEEIEVTKFINAEHTTQCIISVIDKLLSECENIEKIKGIGVSIEGVVNSSQGIIIKASALHWENYNLKAILEKRYSFPVYLENDVNIIAAVENMEGILSDSQNSIILKFDQGIGGAIVFQKNLYTGSNHVAGELGHYKSFKGENAIPCHCGGRGCLTTVASIGAIENSLQKDFDEIIYDLNSGDAQIISRIELIGEAIGNALSNIITFFNPDHVLLTGKLIEKAGYMLVPIIEEYTKSTVPHYFRNVIFKTMTTKNGAVLAGGLVIGEFFKIPEISNL